MNLKAMMPEGSCTSCRVGLGEALSAARVLSCCLTELVDESRLNSRDLDSTASIVCKEII